MIVIIHVNLQGVATENQIYARFNEVFGFPDYFGNNSNAFEDVMRSLNTDSDYFKSIVPEPDGVHIIIENYFEFKEHVSYDLVSSLRSSLIFCSCNKKHRYDHKSFTFEVR